MPLPLEGIRVVDFSRVLAGPHCAKTLLDLGAEVIKLEPPGGDLSRKAFPRHGEISGYYSQQNAGKRNLSIDLNVPGARDVALRLCDTADVIVENFRPGALAAFRLDYESVSARNPGVVYASISGYGQHGPFRSRMAYAPTIQAETGITEMTADHFERTDRLRSDSLSHADVYSGLHAAIAILACLTERERTGRGQYIDVAMAAVMLSINERVHADLSDSELGDERPILGATDGPFFAGPRGERFASPMSLVGSMSFPFYLAAMRRPDLGQDPRFLTPELRLRNLEALHRIVQEWIWTFSDMESLDAQLDEAKIATGRVRSVKEFANSEWARTWNAVRTVSDRSGGEIKIPGRPWHFADQPTAGEGQLAARQGEHNAEILKELGFSASQIGVFEAAGALVQPSSNGAPSSSPDPAMALDANAEAAASVSLCPSSSRCPPSLGRHRSPYAWLARPVTIPERGAPMVGSLRAIGGKAAFRVSTILRARAAPVAAVVLGVVALGLGAAAVVLDSLIHQPGTDGPAADAFIAAAGAVPATAVGTLLAARRPRNPIGWMLLAIIILEISPASQYLILDYRMHHGALPLGWVAVVLQECWPMFLVLISLLLWLFPDGTLPEGRWHRPAAVAAAGWLLVGLAASSRGVLIAAAGDVRIQASGDLASPVPGALRVLDVVVIAGTLASWTAWLAIQVPTYRHASGEHRQQLKWLYSGAAIFVVSLIIGVFIAQLLVEEVPGWGTQSVTDAVVILGTAALPVCMGVAVLKYRLYELNRVISRVVSYTLITVLLGGVFAGLILLATRVLPAKSSVAVAAATLVIAALFNPLRKRVQHAVDRRFNRERYDAEAIVAAFSGRLRQTIDLDAIRGDLVGVVQEAFQPAHMSVWLPGTRPHATVPTPARPGADQPD